MTKPPNPDIPVAEDHDQWFRRQVAGAVREADNPDMQWVSHDTVLQDIADQRATLLAAKEDDGTRYPYKLAQRMMAGDHPVRIFREWREMTQTELADKAGVAGNYISMIERGRNVPSRKLQLALAKALDVDYDMLETAPSFKAE